MKLRLDVELNVLCWGCGKPVEIYCPYDDYLIYSVPKCNCDPESIRWCKEPGEVPGMLKSEAEDRRLCNAEGTWKTVTFKIKSEDSPKTFPGMVKRAFEYCEVYDVEAKELEND